MTLMQASELTGIEQARLASIERGVVEPSGDEVLIIADVYGEPVEFFITNERSASIEKSSDLYRMYGSTFSSVDRRNIQEFLTLCRMEREIEALLGSRPRTFDFHPGRGHRHKKTHGRQVAEKLRADLGLGDDPIDNPFRLARTLGCHVFRRKLLNSAVSGVMLRHDDFGPCILVDYLEDPYRQNFSVAHELCHALLDDDHTVTVSFGGRGEGEKQEDLRQREWRANAFAAHLLFPDSARERTHLGGASDDRVGAVMRAAESYRINPIVVIYALVEAKLLSRREARSLEHDLKIPRSEKEDADLAGETAKVQSRANLGIDDLQDIITLARQRGCNKRLGQGELSCAALARQMGKAVLTDNKRDFAAIDRLADGRLQTTPRLLGWLYAEGHIADSDAEHVRTEHQKSGGQMSKIYKQAYYEACEKRLARQMRRTEASRG